MNDYLLLSELCREPLLTTEEAVVETHVPGAHFVTPSKTHAVRLAPVTLEKTQDFDRFRPRSRAFLAAR